MGLAFYVAFIPHSNFPYPVHIDEWFHWAFADEIINQAGISGLTNPFSGGEPVWNQQFELGFHVFFAVFRQISDIPWLDIVRYFPGIIFIITVLSVYILAQRQGFGWQAALFTCLVPTTVGILGPAFLVPVAMGLLFIPLAIFLAFNLRTIRSYVVLFIFICFLASMHAATAVGIVIILAPFILLNLKGNFKHSLGVTLALIIPFIAAFPWVFDKVLLTAGNLFNRHPLPLYVDIPRVVQTYGYLPILFGLLGIFLLSMRGGKKNYGLILGLLALLVMLATFYTFGYGEVQTYSRGLIYMMLIMSIVAGAGLMGVQNLKLPGSFGTRPKVHLITKALGIMLCLAFIGLTFMISIPQRQSTPYYHMITQEDYQAFVWIRDNVGKDYDKAILDPWKATAFTAITEKTVYSRIHMAPFAKDNVAYAFLQGGSSNTTFLIENGISVVYSQGDVVNPDLVEVRKNVYLVEETGQGQ